MSGKRHGFHASWRVGFDEDGRIEVLQWAFAALNSIEPPVTGWAVARFFHRDEASAARWEEWMTQRLAQLDAVLSTRAFIAAGRFTAADILMTEAVRMAGDEGKLAPHPALTESSTSGEQSESTRTS